MSDGSAAEILFLISNIAFIIGAIALILAAYLFMTFKIPQVIGDLSGRNARRSIEQIRSHNEKTGNKSFRASEINKQRGKLTETMRDIGSGKKSVSSMESDVRPETGLLKENRIRSKTAESTTLLNETDEFGYQVETKPDNPIMINTRQRNRGSKIELKMLDEVILIHTDEKI